VAETGVAVRRACALAGLSRSAWYRPLQDRLVRDQPVIDALHAVLEQRPRWGFWMAFDRLRLDGRPWNHKRVHRIYKALGLNHRRRTKRRLPPRVKHPLVVPAEPNAVWALDFMQDRLYGGRAFRTLNVLDEGVREALEIEIDTSLPGERVVRVLEQLTECRGKPKAIRCDNGPELISKVLEDWCTENDVELRHIQPGKPNQNAFIERFNRSYREEVLSAYLFIDLDQVREISWHWKREYNEVRPHDALGKVPPAVYRQALEAGKSTFKRST